jgi:SH3-like domain-containing protein
MFPIRARRGLAILTTLLMAVMITPEKIVHAQEQLEIGRSTGLPVPRFVSLKRDKVNVRFGPGKQYPINWVFTQRGIPVEIIAEFDNWRKIRDYEGTEGWINAGLLNSRRTIMVQGTVRDLKRTASTTARVMLRAEPGVLGELFYCRDSWCHVEIEERRGWLQRGEFWGTLPDEVVPQ